MSACATRMHSIMWSQQRPERLILCCLLPGAAPCHRRTVQPGQVQLPGRSSPDLRCWLKEKLARVCLLTHTITCLKSERCIYKLFFLKPDIKYHNSTILWNKYVSFVSTVEMWYLISRFADNIKCSWSQAICCTGSSSHRRPVKMHRHSTGWM